MTTEQIYNESLRAIIQYLELEPDQAADITAAHSFNIERCTDIDLHKIEKKINLILKKYTRGRNGQK